MTTALQDRVTQSTLENYIIKQSFNDVIAIYVTTNQLTTALQDKVSQTTLETYVTELELSEALAAQQAESNEETTETPSE